MAFLTPSDAALGVVILAFIALNGLTMLTPLATAFGSKQHGHLNPGGLYHVAAFFFGPLVGLHYLLMTRDGIREGRLSDKQAAA